MKLSIILPTCDVPLDSKRPAPWLRSALESVQSAGHEDFECLVGGDGQLDAVRLMVENLHDERFRLIEFPKTRTWGNFQRHELMTKYATGDYFSFMDHDDQYVPGALASIVEELECFEGRPLFARVRLTCGILIWTQPHLNSKMPLAGHGVFCPRGGGWPVWGPSGDRLEDHAFIHAVFNHGKAVGKPVIWSEQLVALVRPHAPPEIIPWCNPAETLATTR